MISSFGLLTHSSFNILKDSISSLQHFVNGKKKFPELFRGRYPPPPPQKNSGKSEATQIASGLTNFLHRNPWCLTIWSAENTNRGTLGTPQDLKKIILSYLICTQICSSRQRDPDERPASDIVLIVMDGERSDGSRFPLSLSECELSSPAVLISCFMLVWTTCGSSR